MLLVPRFFQAIPGNKSNSSDDSDGKPATLVPMTGPYSLKPLPEGHADSKCHEAGYDALMTAQVSEREREKLRDMHIQSLDSLPVCVCVQVFLMELELFHRHSQSKSADANSNDSKDRSAAVAVGGPHV